MKYLDENIVFKIKIIGQQVTAGTYNYTIKKNAGTEILFVGSVYLNADQINVEIDATDIMRSLKSADTSMKVSPSADINSEIQFLIANMTCTLSVNNTNFSSSVDVAFIYRYPRIINSMLPLVQSSITKFFPLMQGVSNQTSGWKQQMLPRIPYVLTTKFGFGFVSQVPDGMDYASLDFYKGPYSTPMVIGQDITLYLTPNKTNVNYFTLSGIFSDSAVEPSNIDNKSGYIGFSEDQLIAQIDVCPAKYYLQWIDRFGSYQCQPFGAIDTFTTSYERTRMVSYENEQRPIFNQVSAKWSLNTGWIEEQNYPLYESLLVSPKVILYDTENDEAYNVIVTDTEYTEKTFKNQQRRMFNLNLNVQKAKNQSILS